MPRDVRLVPMDEPTQRQLLEMAVLGGTPEEVMPPTEGPPGAWTDQRRQAYLDFFLARQDQMYAIFADDLLVGSIRLTPVETGTAETGMWLRSDRRGQGIGTAALRALLTEAGRAGVHTVVADTAAANRAAVGVLRNAGATLREDDKIYAAITINSEHL